VGRILGTPGYMSPEQARGAPVDARTDVFSFGVVLYEMLTGSRPFRGATTVDLLAALERDDPRPIRELATMPAPLAALIERCLKKDPDDRPEDGAALRDALEAIRSRVPASRRWALPGLAAALVVIAAIALAPWDASLNTLAAVGPLTPRGVPEVASAPAPTPPPPPPPMPPASASSPTAPAQPPPKPPRPAPDPLGQQR
jgi:serine/threonine-protein kinase